MPACAGMGAPAKGAWWTEEGIKSPRYDAKASYPGPPAHGGHVRGHRLGPPPHRPQPVRGPLHRRGGHPGLPPGHGADGPRLPGLQLRLHRPHPGGQGGGLFFERHRGRDRGRGARLRPLRPPRPPHRLRKGPPGLPPRGHGPRDRGHRPHPGPGGGGDGGQGLAPRRLHLLGGRGERRLLPRPLPDGPGARGGGGGRPPGSPSPPSPRPPWSGGRSSSSPPWPSSR